MRPEDARPFLVRLLAVAELFDTALSDGRAMLYFDLLRDLPLETAELGLVACARTCRFFPKPVEIREAALGDPETVTERAWQTWQQAARQIGGYSSLVVEDPALADTLLACYRSWPEACAMDGSPEMAVARRREFGRVYRVKLADRLTGPRWLAGLTEQQNGPVADWLRFTPVARVSLSGTIRTLTPAERDAARLDVAAPAPTSLVEAPATWTPLAALVRLLPEAR